MPVARCGTVWTSPETGNDYLLVADQMLWFGTQLCNSLLNPNQLHAFGVNMNDIPFDLNKDLGIQCDEEFIPCVTRGTIVHFEACVPANWKLKHLPIIHITSGEWDLTDESMYLEQKSCEYKEMAVTIQALTSGTSRQKIMSLKTNEMNA